MIGRARLALVIVAASASACYGGHEGGSDGGPVGASDGGDLDSRAPDEIDASSTPTTSRDVDLLFLVDDSNSMAEEQANLIAVLPRVVWVLTSGDRDADGFRDFPPVSSLHLGVVRSDLGAGPNDGIPTCQRGLGGDGILVRTSTMPGCLPEPTSGVFEFSGSGDPTELTHDFGCVLSLGTGGCGFEQQLEASLKALTPASPMPWTAAGYTPPRFLSADGVPDAEPGQGSRANEGFVRDGSILAIHLVTDEEDCSVRDYGLFVPGEPRFGVPLGLRCNTFGDPAMGIVYPVSRYVDGFVGLRPDPRDLVFAATIGIPPESEADAARGDLAAVLAHPDMAPRPNAMGNGLEPSCSSPDGVALPPIRIVQVAAALASRGASVGLGSICASSFQPPLDALVSRLSR